MGCILLGVEYCDSQHGHGPIQLRGRQALLVCNRLLLDDCMLCTPEHHSDSVLLPAAKTLTVNEVGSIVGLCDLLLAAQEQNEFEGNYQGRLVTMPSQQAILFGIILLVSNVGAAIVSAGGVGGGCGAGKYCNL
ncbi:uncharacterized protein BO97DRAFT_425651 [Aspergillus homomorphus CBS 101889]|uniref:Uncharacterized protein n=1 Tax=Aspergillus homomorphus (strain CBS 101889) TaxID=1450537 RepID=A0A395HU45_ASPHC|nr:hypothetical protein BO97DRAFT_425651 [Aspergillus homomorphus CBS 101889]RAL11337.1 hypothetical protein BO97DRAFT_425651 [Aspergillus homomorphus CBS 101889]